MKVARTAIFLQSCHTTSTIIKVTSVTVVISNILYTAGHNHSTTIIIILINDPISIFYGSSLQRNATNKITTTAIIIVFYSMDTTSLPLSKTSAIVIFLFITTIFNFFMIIQRLKIKNSSCLTFQKSQVYSILKSINYKILMFVFEKIF